MIEAKKFTRKLDARMVTPYLTKGAMGCVTNGRNWLFCADGVEHTCDSLLTADNTICPVVRNFIVSTLSCKSPEDVKRFWDGLLSTNEKEALSKPVKTLKLSAGKGERKFAQKNRYESLGPAVANALKYVVRGGQTEYFLEQLLDLKREVALGYIELNENRMIWRLNSVRRGARINLKSKQLEILVANEILESIGSKASSIGGKIHDKNISMTTCKPRDSAELNLLLKVFDFNPFAS